MSEEEEMGEGGRVTARGGRGDSNSRGGINSDNGEVLVT